MASSSQSNDPGQQRAGDLQFTEKLLRATIDSCMEMIQVFEAVRDEQGTIIDFKWVLNNHASEEIYGDVAGKRLLELQPGVIEEGIFKAFVQVVESGEPQQYEKHYVHEQFDGWFHQSVVKLNDGVATTTTDITNRKKADDQLRESQAFLQSVIDASLDIIQVFKAVRNEAGSIVDFVWVMNNKKAVNQNGEVIGESLMKTNPGVVPTGIFGHMVEVTETGEPFEHEQHYVHEQFDGWFYQALVKADDGVIMTTRDITRRKKAEQEIQEKQALLESVLNNTQSSIMLLKAVRNRSGKIDDFEYVYTREYPLGARAGQRYSDAYPGIRETIVFEKYCEVVETGNNLDTEVEITLRGRNHWFHLMAAKLGDGLVVSAIDITERRQAHEEILSLKEKLAQRAEDKYRGLFNSIDEGFQIYEMLYDDAGKAVDFRYLETNPAYERQTGLKNVAGKLASEVIPNLERHWFDYFDEILKSPVPLHAENYHQATGRWYSITSFRAFSDAQPIIAALFTDITERKQRELHQQFLIKFSDALRAEPDADAIANQAVQMLAEHLRLDRCYVGIALLDDNRGIFPYQFGNEKVAPMPADGVSLSDFPDALRTTFEETLVITDFQNMEGLKVTEKQNFAALGFGALVVANVRKEEKKPYWSINAVSAIPRYWTADEIELIEDATERTWAAVERAKAEEALRESEEKYRTLFNSLDDGFQIFELIYDEAGKPFDVRYIETNYSFELQTGLKNVAGKLASAVGITIEKNWLEVNDAIVKTGKPLRVERYNQSTERWYSAYFYAASNDGRPLVAALFRDITERKQQEAQVRKELQDTRLLQQVSNHIIDEADREAFYDVLLDSAMKLMSADFASIQLLDPQKKELQLLAHKNFHSYSAEHWQWVQAGPGSSCGHALETGERVVVTDLAHPPFDMDQADREAFTRSGIMAVQSTPLVSRLGTHIGMMSTHWRTAHTPSDRELGLFDIVARQVADLFERDRATAALRASEEKYRTLFETMDQGFSIGEVIFNEHGKAIDIRHQEVNPALERVSGLKGEGKLVSEIIPNLEPYWLEPYQQAVLTGESLQRENYNEFTQRWYRANYSRIGGPGSRFVAVIFEDTTEQKQREKQQEFLLKLSDTFRTLSDWKLIEEAGSRMLADFLKLDRAYVFVLYPADDRAVVRAEYRKNNLLSLIGEVRMSDFPETVRQIEDETIVFNDIDNDARLSDLNRESLHAVNLQSFMCASVRKGEGNVLWSFAAAVSTPRVWTSNEVALIETVAERIWAAAERAKAENALRESEKRFQSIANLVPDLLWASEPDGSTNWHNQRWLEYTGQTFEQAIGWGWTDAIHPDDRKGSARRYGQAVEAATALRQEYRIRQHNGQYRWFVMNASPLTNEMGQVTKMYGAATDIHEIKQLETKLLEANRRKDEFLAMLAHELRNPMATIRSGLKILELTTADDTTRSTVTMMDRQTDFLVRMVDDLLDVSRISQGKIELKEERVDLAGLVAQAAAGLRPRFDEHTHFLHVELPASPVFVHGDSARLTQVISNLLTNGLRYSKEKGNVWIRMKSHGNEAEIEVSDDGIGLAEDQIQAIFELFVQVDNSLARSKGGLGLGLTLVKRLVEMHGGRVEARSEGLGKGSSFFVYIPVLAPIAEKPDETLNQPSHSGVARRVLVIDDNTDAGFTLGMLLKLKGYEAHVRTSGPAGIEAGAELNPSTILLDIGMPGMDGYETCRLIRQQPWGQQAVIIALTGYGQQDDLRRATQAGFDGHLIKPVGLDQLSEAIEHFASKK